MRIKKNKKSTSEPLPRSILSSLHEPLLDPKDGHGARSARDVMIRQKWAAARKGDDGALIGLVKIVVSESLAELKNARGVTRVVDLGGGEVRMRSLVPVMALLRMISVETVAVPPEHDGYVKVTRRQKIIFEKWFEEYALVRDGLDPETVSGVHEWQALGSIQRPHRGECMD